MIYYRVTAFGGPENIVREVMTLNRALEIAQDYKRHGVKVERITDYAGREKRQFISL